MLPIRLFLAVSMLLPSALRAQIGLRPTAVLHLRHLILEPKYQQHDDNAVDVADGARIFFSITYNDGSSVHIEDYGRVENHTLIALYDMLNNIAGTHHWKLKSP